MSYGLPVAFLIDGTAISVVGLAIGSDLLVIVGIAALLMALLYAKDETRLRQQTIQQ